MERIFDEVRALIQRVSEASVRVDSEIIGSIGRGFLVFLGVGHEDTESVPATLAKKTAALRVFPDSANKMNLSLKDVNGAALVVSQFTLYADTRKGNRPAFTYAAPPDQAERLYLSYVEALKNESIHTETGKFAADMRVQLINDGPVTILLEV